MNILFLESSIPPTRGGVQRVSWINSRFFNEHGHDSFFAFWLKDYDEVDDYHKIRIGNNGVVGNCKKELYAFIRERKINIIINQQCTNKYVTHVLKTVKEECLCKIIYCLHISPNYGDFFPRSIKHVRSNLKNTLVKMFYGIDLYSYIERKQYQLSDCYVLLSETYKKDFLIRTHIDDTTKLYSLLNPSPYSYNLQDNGKERNKQILIIVRMHEQQKNLMSALRIWKRIEQYGCNDWGLTIGGYGPDESQIINYASSLKLKQVKFIGKVEDPCNLYQTSPIFMMTSNYEGLPMSLIEALQFGCIPMAFNTFTALHDILVDGYNGYIIPAKDEQTYAEKMIELIKNPTILETMSKNAIESSKKFSIDTIGKQWLNLINELNR